MRPLDYVRERVLEASDDDKPYALLEWANDEQPLPVTDPSLDGLIREWWQMQRDPKVLLSQLGLADCHRAVHAAYACATWAINRNWNRTWDIRPYRAIEMVRIGASAAICDIEAKGAFNAAHDAYEDRNDAAVFVARAAANCAKSAKCARSGDSREAGNWAAGAADDAAQSDVNGAGDWQWRARMIDEKLAFVCDLIRAVVECPPTELWIRAHEEFRREDDSWQ